ncbi:MAG: response regulator [Sediminibacterium sp.]|jgi:DNA-binding NarL/FixJ family response regulator|nr:response regulator transcription factor [Sediminibacterium sp.]MCA6441030.1 response regulator transcription factor [Chitinophagaceae bacterium]MCA6446423.1 response regulator transcription factor [Chitinophagaceae bacterium]
MITLAIAEDKEHHNARIVKAIARHKDLNLSINATNGFELLQKLNSAKELPKILLLDIEMPKIDGLICTSYLCIKYPPIKIIGVSTHSNEALVAEVITEGATSFITKHFVEPDSISYKPTYGNRDILREAIDQTLLDKQFIDVLVYNKKKELEKTQPTTYFRQLKYPELSPQLTEFLILNATNLPFIDIAGIMIKSRASIKSYYDKLSTLFEVNTRAELICYCLKHGLVKLPNLYDKFAS